MAQFGVSIKLLPLVRTQKSRMSWETARLLIEAGRDGLRGEIAVGMRADIIAVDGNPLENIEVMEHVSFVMKGGKVYKQN